MAEEPEMQVHGSADGDGAPAVLLRKIDSVDIRLQLESAAALVRRAHAANTAAEHALAIELCSEAIVLAPTSAEAFLERSRAHLAIYRRDSGAVSSRAACLRDAKRAAFMKPTSWRCALQRSRALGAIGEYEEAMRVMDEVDELARTDAEGESAKEVAFALADQRGRLQLELAKAAKAKGAPEQRWMWMLADTVSTLDKALAAKPKSADTLNNRGVAYYEARSYVLAMADFEAALRIEERHDRALSNKALVQRVQQKLLAAHATLCAAIAENPSSAVSFNNLGCLERDLGRPLAALLAFSKAAEMDPTYDQAVRNRNTVLSELRHPVPLSPADDVPLPGRSCGQP